MSKTSTSIKQGLEEAITFAKGNTKEAVTHNPKKPNPKNPPAKASPPKNNTKPYSGQ